MQLKTLFHLLKFAKLVCSCEGYYASKLSVTSVPCARHNATDFNQTIFFPQSLGGLAYQAMHQRILSASSVRDAQVICFAAASFSFILGIPSVLAGAVAASTSEKCSFLPSYPTIPLYEIILHPLSVHVVVSLSKCVSFQYVCVGNE